MGTTDPRIAQGAGPQLAALVGHWIDGQRRLSGSRTRVEAVLHAITTASGAATAISASITCDTRATSAASESAP